MKPTTMKKEYYYAITDTNYTKHPIRYIEKEDHFFRVFFPNDSTEKKLKDNIHFQELHLTNNHLERMGFIDNNNKFIPIAGYYIFPQYAIGLESKFNLNSYFFGYSLISIDEADNYWLQYKDAAKDYFDGNITATDLQSKFSSFFTVNELFEKLEKLHFSIPNKDFVVAGKTF